MSKNMERDRENTESPGTGKLHHHLGLLSLSSVLRHPTRNHPNMLDRH